MDEQRKYAIFLPQQSWQHGNSTKLMSDHARRGSAPSRMPSQRQGKSLRGLTNDGRTNDESRFPLFLILWFAKTLASGKLAAVTLLRRRFWPEATGTFPGRHREIDIWMSGLEDLA